MLKHHVPILKPDQSYDFHCYCKLRYPVDEILQELGASFSVGSITFPAATAEAGSIATDLQPRLEKRRRRIRLNSEAARREALIAPVLLEVADSSSRL